MYAWLWRKLPGPWPVKTLESLVLFVATCALLVVVVFPWVEPKLPFSDNVVDGSVPAAATESPEPVGSPTDVDGAEDDADQDGKGKKKNKKKKNKDAEDDDAGLVDSLPGDG